MLIQQQQQSNVNYSNTPTSLSTSINPLFPSGINLDNNCETSEDTQIDNKNLKSKKLLRVVKSFTVTKIFH